MLGVIVTYNPELKSLISDLIEPLKNMVLRFWL
jgi:hypothetical protein